MSIIPISFALGSSVPTKDVVYASTPLHNLYDDSAIQGGFFLGSGSVNEVEYYFYNAVTDRGFSPQRIVKYNNGVYVREDEEINPRLDVVCSEAIEPSHWGLVLPDCYKVFHVPAGSVDTNYNVK